MAGVGSFGKVWKGTYNGRSVAIKCFYSEDTDVVGEINLMERVSESLSAPLLTPPQTTSAAIFWMSGQGPGTLRLSHSTALRLSRCFDSLRSRTCR